MTAWPPLGPGAKRVHGMLELFGGPGRWQWSARHPATRREVIRLRFNLGLKPPLSYRQIANWLGVSASMVQRTCLAEEERRAALPPKEELGAGLAPAGAHGGDPQAAAPSGPRYAAYDDATMAVAADPFSWQEAEFRFAGLVYRADGGTVLVFVGARADGYVHLFGARVTKQDDAFSLAKSLRALHKWGPVDAVLHSPDQPQEHLDRQTHETLERLLRELPFPLVPGPRSGDFRERLTETLEAGQFTIDAGPDADGARQELKRAATHRGHAEGPAITALCYILHYLQKRQDD